MERYKPFADESDERCALYSMESNGPDSIRPQQPVYLACEVEPLILKCERLELELNRALQQRNDECRIRKLSEKHALVLQATIEQLKAGK
jgi:hypothetical protein